ncbi:DUF2971 domain-containing protein [Methylobacterium soli]|uniref:DUF2971 domain-containing protein n=1 Tax=Methylobacterium soli TaxID=553447 RepID=A0A6L3STC8_9HYPH|nr:DUF2971 domain-containing protein [Methylobacterium soli]KAB1076692.1 DUF2971 domain-containing protein [Methylobacterium soli]
MPILYHYTTPAGLEGILRSRGLWVTDTRFLNDRREFKIGWDVLSDTYKKRKAEIAAISAPAIDNIEGYMEGIEYTNAYVASFSVNGDILSQWRGYNGGFGFSIAFDRDLVQKIANGQNFKLSKVLYDSNQHWQIIDMLFNDLCGDLKRTDSENVAPITFRWWRRVLRVVSIIKDRHFSEECEVRLFAEYWNDSNVKVRSTERKLIPYLEMMLGFDMIGGQDIASLAIQHVIVGPAMMPNQRYAAEHLLKQYEIEAPVYESSIPYIAS